MSWNDTRKAIQDAIVMASGLDDGHVIWGYQNADQPTLSYVSLALSPLSVIGLDSLATDYDGARDPGLEIRQTVTGVREVGLEVSVFTTALAGSGDALDLCEKIRASLLLPSVRSQMTAHGVTPFDPGPVQYIPEIVSAGFRGRAMMNIRCYMPPPAVVEYCGYIAEVKGKATLPAPKGDIPFDFVSV